MLVERSAADLPDLSRSVLSVSDSGAELEETLTKLAKFGEQLQGAKTISPIMLKEIARDCDGLLMTCDEVIMEHLVEQGLLKQMVDTELLRKALNFFRIWVNIRISPISGSVGLESRLDFGGCT